MNEHKRRRRERHGVFDRMHRDVIERVCAADAAYFELHPDERCYVRDADPHEFCGFMPGRCWPEHLAPAATQVCMVGPGVRARVALFVGSAV